MKIGKILKYISATSVKIDGVKVFAFRRWLHMPDDDCRGVYLLSPIMGTLWDCDRLPAEGPFGIYAYNDLECALDSGGDEAQNAVYAVVRPLNGTVSVGERGWSVYGTVKIMELWIPDHLADFAVPLKKRYHVRVQRMLSRERLGIAA